MISGIWKLLSSVCVESRFGQAGKKSEHPINVSANQNAAFDKKVFLNNNTSVQSNLGEHGPLKHDLLCLSLKWTQLQKKNSKTKHAYTQHKKS